MKTLRCSNRSSRDVAIVMSSLRARMCRKGTDGTRRRSHRVHGHKPVERHHLHVHILSDSHKPCDLSPETGNLFKVREAVSAPRIWVGGSVFISWTHVNPFRVGWSWEAGERWSEACRASRNTDGRSPTCLSAVQKTWKWTLNMNIGLPRPSR